LPRCCGWRAVFGAELSPDIGYLVFNILPYLMESDQGRFQLGCVGHTSPSWLWQYSPDALLLG
jgi:hypothetical protein